MAGQAVGVAGSTRSGGRRRRRGSGASGSRERLSIACSLSMRARARSGSVTPTARGISPATMSASSGLFEPAHISTRRRSTAATSSTPTSARSETRSRRPDSRSSPRASARPRAAISGPYKRRRLSLPSSAASLSKSSDQIGPRHESSDYPIQIDEAQTALRSNYSDGMSAVV